MVPVMRLDAFWYFALFDGATTTLVGFDMK
jgi:hypothetical protein